MTMELENHRIAEETVRIINDFLESKVQAGRSPDTIRRYRRLLERFFLHCQKSLEDLVPGDVSEWLASQYADAEPVTQAHTLSVLSSFFRFCLDEGHIRRLLIKKRMRPRLPDALPRYLGKDDQAALRLQAEKRSLRDWALFEFMISSGCRRSEVIGLNLNDVNLASRTATVTGKGNKTRQVHFSEGCAVMLGKYLDRRRGDSEALFLNRSGDRLSDKGVYRVTVRFGQLAGLPRLTPHMFRHTFATNFLGKGVGLDFIKEELGHKGINTTMIFAKVPDKKLVAAYRKYMG
jgi:site-specific recombinase XerD